MKPKIQTILSNTASDRGLGLSDLLRDLIITRHINPFWVRHMAVDIFHIPEHIAEKTIEDLCSPLPMQ